jgi:ABC-type amino acid transport substrate-binding protein
VLPASPAECGAAVGAAAAGVPAVAPASASSTAATAAWAASDAGASEGLATADSSTSASAAAWISADVTCSMTADGFGGASFRDAGRGRFVLGLGFGLGIREQRRRALATLAGRGPDRGQAPTRASSRSRGTGTGSAVATPSIRAERLLLAVEELDLELHEALDDPAPGDRVDLVEAELDDRLVGLELPLAAELADRDELDQRCVAALLEDERAGVGMGPVARPGRPVGRSLELLAAVRRSLAVAAGDRLHGDRRALGGLPQPAANPARASAPSAVSR